MKLQTPDKTRLEYELTICELERERDPWMNLRARVARAAGLDSRLNGDLDLQNMRMDYLLEELFTKMGQLSVLGVEHGNK